MQSFHTPVMLEEVIRFMEPARERFYLDGTLGTGGHAEAILQESSPTGRLIGIDADSDSLSIARERLSRYGGRFVCVHARYDRAREILLEQGVERVHGVLLDLGISRIQLEMEGRGFSFARDDPLDMRMDTTKGLTAAAMLKRLSEDEMARLFHTYGEERWARRIARAIRRKQQNQGDIRSTLELANTIRSAIPRQARRPYRIHPATRSFQALRITVNQELESLENFLNDLPEILEPGGRCCVLSFHSLEDRIVKQAFRRIEESIPAGDGSAALPGQARFQRVQKKVVKPSPQEVARNPLARSAKLRVLERLE